MTNQPKGKALLIISHLQMLGATLIYAMTFSLAKMVMPQYILPSSFTLLRVLTGCVFFWVLSFWVPKVKFSRKDWILLLSCGIFGTFFNQLIYFQGLELTTPINAAIVMPSTPIVVYLISIIFLKEKSSWIRISGILIGFLGVVFLISLGEEKGYKAKNPALGNLFVFLNSSSYAIYLILVKSLLKSYHPYVVLKWVYLFGILFVFPFGISGIPTIQWSTIPIQGYLIIGFVLLFTTCFTYLLNLFALRKVSSTTLSAYVYLQPVFATIIAILLGSDQLNWIKGITFLIIVFGLYLVNSPKWLNTVVLYKKNKPYTKVKKS